MKFNHYTINTYNNVVQDSKEILEDNKYRGYLCNLLKQIKDNRDTPLHLTKNIYVKGVVEENVYAITLQNKKGVPLLETMGALDEQGAVYVKKCIKKIHKAVFDSEITIVNKSAPIVFDMLYPTIIFNPNKTMWTGAFCRTMGAIAFEEMKKESC